MMSNRNQTPPTGQKNNADHKHNYKITLAELFARRPTFQCLDCHKRLKPTRSMDIVNQVLFYIFLAFVIFTADFGPIAGRKTEDILLYVGKVAAAFIVYLLLRYVTARFGPIEEMEETEPTAEEIAAAEKQKEIYEQEMAAVNQEKQALMDMYRSYETTADPTAVDTPVQDVGPAGEGLAQAVAQDEPLDAECKHEIKSDWKNFLPGRRVFYCKHCGHPLKMSKKQSNIVNGVFFAGFILLLLGDTMDLAVPWSQIILKTLILLVLVVIVQVVLLHVYPLEPMTTEDMMRFKIDGPKHK
ncbi:MAG TPA: hypothetical protein GX717_00630 [Clostridiaceae bacterium]|nr:hypothetical protein [Clostridiaceae bacterium]